MGKELISERYHKAVVKFRMLAEKEEKLLVVFSVMRLVSFIGGLIVIWFGFKVSNFLGSLFILLTVSIFLYFLKLYWIHSEKKEFYNNLAKINQNEADAIAGDLSAFESGVSYIDTEHDFSNDVDLFGNSSLFQYLNRTITEYGRDILAAWLSDPVNVSSEINRRQEVIKELALKENWRHEFMASGLNNPLEKGQIIGLLQWMGDENERKSSSVKKILMYFLPATAIISLVLLITGALQYYVFMVIILFNLLYITLGLKKTNHIHQLLSSKYNYLSSFDKLLKLFENESFNSDGLRNIKLNISGKEKSAAIAVRRLSHLIQSFDSRLNLLVAFILNGLILWDYHIIHRLEKWKLEYKEILPMWLEMLGQVDAYISLANYAGNNHDFAYPVVSDKNIILYARNLGHQLIDEKLRVCNDFILERQGVICIITGANMAGKSTFLRTIAVNYVLAMTGAPVCASEMTFTPLHLFTSMRTTDSLSNSESYFYAELKRLKTLKSRIESGDMVLFILDEILKGTNSEDKSVGSKLFLERILELGGTGLIATHDVSLGELEKDHPEVIVNKCFEIEIDGETIKFDYKIQKGITHKMNATLLMKQMGI